MIKIIYFEKLKDSLEKDRNTKLCLEQQISIIENIEEQYPYIKILINEEQLQIINEIIFDEIKNNSKKVNYFECLGEYISDILYDVVYFNSRLDIDTFKRHIIFLNKYFDLTSLINIATKMEEELKPVPCKIIEFKGK